MVQRLSRALIEFAGHRVELCLAVHREVRAFRQTVSQQPVGFLVRAALPGSVGIAEVDIDLGGQRQSPVIRESLPRSQVSDLRAPAAVSSTAG